MRPVNKFVKTIVATLLEGCDFTVEVLLHGFLQIRPNTTESRQFGCQISAVITQYFPSSHCSRFICYAGSRETDCLLMVTISFFFRNVYFFISIDIVGRNCDGEFLITQTLVIRIVFYCL